MSHLVVLLILIDFDLFDYSKQMWRAFQSKTTFIWDWRIQQHVKNQHENENETRTQTENKNGKSCWMSLNSSMDLMEEEKMKAQLMVVMYQPINVRNQPLFCRQNHNSISKCQPSWFKYCVWWHCVSEFSVDSGKFSKN